MVAIFEEYCDPSEPEAACVNPCECESYFINQQEGRLRVFSAGLIGTDGEAYNVYFNLIGPPVPRCTPAHFKPFQLAGNYQ